MGGLVASQAFWQVEKSGVTEKCRRDARKTLEQLRRAPEPAPWPGLSSAPKVEDADLGSPTPAACVQARGSRRASDGHVVDRPSGILSRAGSLCTRRMASTWSSTPRACIVAQRSLARFGDIPPRTRRDRPYIRSRARDALRPRRSRSARNRRKSGCRAPGPMRLVVRARSRFNRMLRSMLARPLLPSPVESAPLRPGAP